MLPFGRQVGVAVPVAGSTEQTPAMTVTHVAPIQFVGIQYGDETGRTRRTIGAIMGNQVYEMPNGEQIASQMATFVKSISNQILDKAAPSDSGDDAIPAKGGVAVMRPSDKNT